jgi:hypothetical protein
MGLSYLRSAHTRLEGQLNDSSLLPLMNAAERDDLPPFSPSEP